MKCWANPKPIAVCAAPKQGTTKKKHHKQKNQGTLHQGLCGVSQWLTSVECHARKCDPDGAQVRRFCPELAGLPLEHLHAPWAAPPGVLRPAGAELGSTVHHKVLNWPNTNDIVKSLVNPKRISV